jgi:hypothetical protein
MEGTFDTSGLQGMSAEFSAAGADVARLAATLATGADAPGSSTVIGSAAAAERYAQVLTEWRHSLTQLSASLQTMSAKLDVAAGYYGRTEAEIAASGQS